MEISPLLVYLALEVRSFGFFFVICAFICGCIAGILFLLSGSFDECARTAKKPLIWGLIFMFIACALPSTKTIAAMVIIPPLVNNEKVRELPSDILDFVSALIRENTPKKCRVHNHD